MKCSSSPVLNDRLHKIKKAFFQKKNSAQNKSAVTQVHDWVVYRLGGILGSVGHRVKIHNITPATGKERGDVEIRDYVVFRTVRPPIPSVSISNDLHPDRLIFYNSFSAPSSVGRSFHDSECDKSICRNAVRLQIPADSVSNDLHPDVT